MQRLTLQHACLYAKEFAAHIWQALFAREPLSRAADEELRRCMLARGGARAPADMPRDVLGGEEPGAEAFLREVAPALVGAMDDGRGHAGACGGEALRVRLDGSPGTPE